ncbi:hypothetical protein ACRALDRAFT_1066933 [Sodiomyces alcalophilus JCM 7366]|uniref:uncharacterized protein n=1 Tax=Sodiomyces alcalophilus JCM 7366 TaxID=591952 RepID=UPI0039B44BD5
MGEHEQGLDSISNLITTYNELNSHVIDELSEEPSPLEFLRYVARNTPNADAPTALPDGSLALAKPHEEDHPFASFLASIIQQTKQDLSPPSATREPTVPEVLYAQTQNDNLRNEYAPLLALHHLPTSIPFARIALDQTSPDALNLWVGNARSVTALHKDNYENIYVQLRGRKRFVLLPPWCHPCVNERPLRAATYRRQPADQPSPGQTDRGDKEEGGLVGEADKEGETPSGASNGSTLVLEPDEGADDVPFATWDPDKPDANPTPYSHLAVPIRVDLEPGDMLYLPAMWYHKVSQFCVEGDEGFVLAVNYWYDMDFSGPLYPLASFVRDVHHEALAGQGSATGS